MRCLYIIAYLVLWLYYPLNSQPRQYRFSRIDISQGLSNNEVNCIFKDEMGFMWFGTRSGLSRFDGYKFKIFKHDIHDTSSVNDEEIDKIFEGPQHTLWINTKSSLEVYNLLTEKFDHHPEIILHSMGIKDTYLADLKKDTNGNFWFLGSSSGLYKYDPVKKISMHFDDADSFSNPVKTTGFTLSNNGYLWIVKSDGLIEKLDAYTGRIVFITKSLQNISPKDISQYSIFADAQNGLWIYPPGIAIGIFYYDIETNKLLHIQKGNDNKSLNNEVIRNIVQDKNGLIWIATDHGGINLLNKKTFTFSYLLNSQYDDQSIAQNSINTLFIDNNGIVWIGTFKKGICYYHKEIIKFPLYRNRPSDPTSLPYNDINRFLEDAAGNIWIGTNGGGLIYFNRKTGKYTRYIHNPANSNSLCNDVIVSLCLDHEQTLWIGTYFGGLDHFDGKTFTHYRHNNADTFSISNNAIWSVMEDSLHRLWIGTFSSGLDIFDRTTGKFAHYTPLSTSIVQSNYVCDIIQAKNGDIWIATSTGVDVVKKQTCQVIHYTHNASNPASSLSNDNTIALLQDSRGIIWVATREGLNYFNADKGTFTSLRKEDGLPENIILSVVEDAQHNLWAATPNGLSNIVVNTNQKTGKLVFQFKNYDESDGLQGKEFNEYAALATREGELLFGGANGFNLFTPSQIVDTNFNSRLVLTDLQMFNKSVNVGEHINGHVILPQSISETQKIVFKYNENIFSIEFAALSFFNKSKLHYVYTLQGFNNEWFIADDKTHKATYTNLDPGNYVFKVKTISENGVWSKESAILNIEILPPFWRTSVAYIIYLLLFALSLYFARRMVLKRAKIRFALEQERREAHRLHELDMLKIRFFTNLSHEFRTPLSLILTPMDKIIRNTAEAVQKHQLQIVQRNARRLLNLVNQLLDFRQMEMRELKLCAAEGDIIRFIKDVADSFIDLAEKKHITFSIIATEKTLYTLFDHDKIERILLNLLSNAFKFTHENGFVSIQLNADRKEDITMLEIKVSDTGIGISRDKHEKIFEHFFQSDIPESMINQGSGIGLSITKEFVKLHNGNISVESEIDKGSCFTILLPLKEIAGVNKAMEIEEEYETKNESSAEKSDNRVNNDGIIKAARKVTVLIIEDNDDLRFYLKENLKQYFNIIEAADGKTGWQKTLSFHPDVIISDINMPIMNGIELCKKIKNDKRTCFVPVILLTAITAEEQQLNGLETGADDYIMKPFNFEILLYKIRNLLKHQETVKHTYQKQVVATPSVITIDSPEQKFLQQVLVIMEKEIGKPGFSVEELSRKLFISRVALYKKLLALTGKTPLEFIRSFRLKRAAQLLEKTTLNVAEVAYQVGFNNPKYFSKFFKIEFNMLPSAYQLIKRKEALADKSADKEESKPVINIMKV